MMAAFDFDTGTVGAEFGKAVHKQIVRERLFVRDYLDSQTIGFLPSLTLTTENTDEIIERLDLAITATASALS